MNIKDLVGAGKTVRFQHYQSGELWYVTDCGFQFVCTQDNQIGVLA